MMRSGCAVLEYGIPPGSVNCKCPPLVEKLVPVTVNVVRTVVDAVIVVGLINEITGAAAALQTLPDKPANPTSSILRYRCRSEENLKDRLRPASQELLISVPIVVMMLLQPPFARAPLLSRCSAFESKNGVHDKTKPASRRTVEGQGRLRDGQRNHASMPRFAVPAASLPGPTTIRAEWHRVVVVK